MLLNHVEVAEEDPSVGIGKVIGGREAISREDSKLTREAARDPSSTWAIIEHAPSEAGDPGEGAVCLGGGGLIST